MNNRRTLALFLVGFLLASPLSTNAGVDEDSIFAGARNPASELDLQLSVIQNWWWQRYINVPDEETRAKHPLITQTCVWVELDYYGGDRISAKAWVRNLDGFLKLSAEQRKQLVRNTLKLVKSHLFMAALLVDKKTGRRRLLENRHIKLAMMINDIAKNDKNENIRLFFLPSELGVGQAGYKDGQFVFSETYFLNLKVHGGVALSGDPNRFIIEHE